MALRKSILDFAMDDAKQLEKRLGYTDKRKLDEYLESVREMERRVEAMAESDGFAEGFVLLASPAITGSMFGLWRT